MMTMTTVGANTGILTNDTPDANSFGLPQLPHPSSDEFIPDALPVRTLQFTLACDKQ